MNIYNFASNEGEWTLEKTSVSSTPCALRGGYYSYTGSGSPASCRYDYRTAYANDNIGFRPTLYVN